MSSNLGDFSNQILTAGKSSAEEDQNSKGSVIYLATGSDDDDDDDNDNDDDDDFSKSIQRQETPLNRTLFSDDYLFYNYLLVSIRTRQTKVIVESKSNGFR